MKGKVVYRFDSEEYLIIFEDSTSDEKVVGLTNRDDFKNRLIS